MVFSKIIYNFWQFFTMVVNTRAIKNYILVNLIFAKVCFSHNILCTWFFFRFFKKVKYFHRIHYIIHNLGKGFLSAFEMTGIRNEFDKWGYPNFGVAPIKPCYERVIIFASSNIFWGIKLFSAVVIITWLPLKYSAMAVLCVSSNSL